MRQDWQARIFPFVAAAAVISLLSLGLIGCRSSRAAARPAAGRASAQAPITLDPSLFKGNVRKAYTIARDHPALLAQLHCYCGCDKEMGHRNLLDCFRTAHGSTCDICVGEALKAEALASRGSPVEQIRDALRVEYGHGG